MQTNWLLTIFLFGLTLSLINVNPHVIIGSESLKKAFGQDALLKYSFVEKWGSSGSGPSHFTRPHDVAFDSKGNVYVSERENNNVQKFTHNGTFIKMWGSKGSGNGEFSIPYSIGIDSQDKIYVVDRENHRIQIFDTNGTFIGKVGNGRGHSNNQFDRPEDIVLSPFGIFVADTGNDRIMKFDNNFTLIDKWGTKGTGDGKFIHPHAWDGLIKIFAENSLMCWR